MVEIVVVEFVVVEHSVVKVVVPKQKHFVIELMYSDLPFDAYLSATSSLLY